MIKINDYFNNGLVTPMFIAEKNIFIWKYIANEIQFLKTQKKSTQQLYYFIQNAAQSNFVLHLGKLFDTPNKKFPSRCIESFLDLLESEKVNIAISQAALTKELLVKYSCPEDLIKAVDDSAPDFFPKEFSKYYKKKYSNLEQDKNTLRRMRDKSYAHNEAVEDLYLPFAVTENLISFASEIIAIFGLAYHSTIWCTREYSMVRAEAERDARFIKDELAALKNK